MNRSRNLIAGLSKTVPRTRGDEPRVFPERVNLPVASHPFPARAGMNRETYRRHARPPVPRTRGDEPDCQAHGTGKRLLDRSPHARG